MRKKDFESNADWIEIWIAYFEIYIFKLDKIWEKWSPQERHFFIRPWFFLMACIETWWITMKFFWGQHTPAPGGAVVWFMLGLFVILIFLLVAVWMTTWVPHVVQIDSAVTLLIFKLCVSVILFFIYWLIMMWVTYFYEDFSALKAPWIRKWMYKNGYL